MSLFLGLCILRYSKGAAVKKTWAALNYLWYLWAIKTFSKSLWQVFFPANFELDWAWCPYTLGHHNPVICSWQLSLPAEPLLLGGDWRKNYVSLCQYSPLLVAQPYLLVIWKCPPSLLVFSWKSENNVVLCFTRQKMNAWLSLVCSISPVTASCWVGTYRSSSFSTLNLFWY